MATVSIPDQFTTDLTGKTAIITGAWKATFMKVPTVRLIVHQRIGGASGIGLATAKILSSLGAEVHILDICPLEKEDVISHPALVFHSCDVTSWVQQRSAFKSAGHVDMVFANAGLSEKANYFTDVLDSNGDLQEPPSTLLDVNLTGVLYTVKLAWYAMKQQNPRGSIVITTSGTAYVPWQSLAVYTSAKLAASDFPTSIYCRYGPINLIYTACRTRPILTLPSRLR